MHAELLKCIAATNFFYEKVALYYQYNYCTISQNDYLELPDCVYLAMFRNTVAKLPDSGWMVKELEANVSEYFEEFDYESHYGEIKRDEDRFGFWAFSKKIWRIRDCFISDVNLGINIYIISAYIFINNSKTLLYDRFGYDETEIRLLYYLLLVDMEIPENILDSYCEKKGLDRMAESGSLLKYSIKELILSYFNQITRVFDKDIHESWERNMGQDRSNLLLKVEKLFQGNKIVLRRVMDNPIEEGSAK